MMTEVPQIQPSNVRTQEREPTTHQGRVRRTHCRSSQSAKRDEYQKPLREPPTEIITVPSPTCQKPGQEKRPTELVGSSVSDVVNTMTVSSDEANKIATVPNDLLRFKVLGCVLNQGKYTRPSPETVMLRTIFQQREGSEGRDRQACLRRYQQASLWGQMRPDIQRELSTDEAKELADSLERAVRVKLPRRSTSRQTCPRSRTT